MQNGLYLDGVTQIDYPNQYDWPAYYCNNGVTLTSCYTTYKSVNGGEWVQLASEFQAGIVTFSEYVDEPWQADFAWRIDRRTYSGGNCTGNPSTLTKNVAVTRPLFTARMTYDSPNAVETEDYYEWEVETITGGELTYTYQWYIYYWNSQTQYTLGTGTSESLYVNAQTGDFDIWVDVTAPSCNPPICATRTLTATAYVENYIEIESSRAEPKSRLPETASAGSAKGDPVALHYSSSHGGSFRRERRVGTLLRWP
jgi:hypothetical protein